MISMVSESYYDLLDIDSFASSTEIKKAYFKKIREFPNETHPNEFQALYKAYKVLMDIKERKIYDRNINDNGEYIKTLDEINNLIETDKNFKALEILYVLERFYKDDYTVLNKLAICLMRTENYEKAKLYLTKLEKLNPTDELTLSLIARNYLYLKEYELSKTYYERLISSNKSEPEYIFDILNVYIETKEYDLGIKTIENYLLDKKESVRDYPLLEQLYYLTIVKDDDNYHKKVIDRIKSLPVTPEDKKTLLNMLAKTCEVIGNNHIAYKELLRLIREINSNELKYITEMVEEAESYIIKDMVYYGDVTYENSEEVERGSIGFSIILGIVLSFIITPFGGIIGGFVWYYRGPAIKRLLTCLIYILIIISILSFCVAIL